MRRYPMKNVLNMRDLGGYPAAGGARTRYGRFIRSDAPRGLAPEELDGLLALGLTTVVDLRGAGECAAEPSDLAGAPGVRVVSVPLDDGIPWPGYEAGIPGYYLEMAEGPAYLTAMRAMAAAPGTVLFHCAVGKDRTGVIAAGLLALCGVEAADIIADYQVSSTYLSTPAHGYGVHLEESKPAHMHTLLKAIEQRHGGIPALLEKAGLTPKEMDALRQKLLGA